MAKCVIKFNRNQTDTAIAKDAAQVVAEALETGIVPTFPYLLRRMQDIGFKSLNRNVGVEIKNLANLFAGDTLAKLAFNRELNAATIKKHNFTENELKALDWVASSEATSFVQDIKKFRDMMANEYPDVSDPDTILDITNQWIKDNPRYNNTPSTQIIEVEGDNFIVFPENITLPQDTINSILAETSDALKAKVAVFFDYLTSDVINSFINKDSQADTISYLNNELLKSPINQIPIDVVRGVETINGTSVTVYNLMHNGNKVGTLPDITMLQDAHQLPDLKYAYQSAELMFGADVVAAKLQKIKQIRDALVTEGKYTLALTGLGRGNYNYEPELLGEANAPFKEVHNPESFIGGNLPAGLSVSKRGYTDMRKYKLQAGVKLNPQMTTQLERILNTYFEGSLTDLIETTDFSTIKEEDINTINQIKQWFVPNKAYLKPFALTSFDLNPDFDIPVRGALDSDFKYYEKLNAHFERFGRVMLNPPVYTFGELMKKFNKKGDLRKVISDIQEDESKTDVNKAKLAFTFIDPKKLNNVLTTANAHFNTTPTGRDSLINSEADSNNLEAFKNALLDNNNEVGKSIFDFIVETASENIDALNRSQVGNIFVKSNLMYDKYNSQDKQLRYLFSYLPLLDINNTLVHPLNVLWQGVVSVNPDAAKATKGKSLVAYLYGNRTSPMNIATGIVKFKKEKLSFDEQRALTVLADKLSELDVVNIETLMFRNKQPNKFFINPLLFKPTKDNKGKILDFTKKLGGIAEVDLVTMGKLGIDFSVPKLPRQPNLRITVNPSMTSTEAPLTIEAQIISYREDINRDTTIDKDTKESILQAIDSQLQESQEAGTPLTSDDIEIINAAVSKINRRKKITCKLIGK